MNLRTLLRAHGVYAAIAILLAAFCVGMVGRGQQFAVPGADGTRMVRHLLVAFVPPLVCVSLIPVAPDFVGTTVRERPIRMGHEAALLVLSLLVFSVGWFGAPLNHVLAEFTMTLFFLGAGFLAASRWGLGGIVGLVMATTAWLLSATSLASLLGFGDVTPEPRFPFTVPMGSRGWVSLGLSIALVGASIPLSTSPRWSRPNSS